MLFGRCDCAPASATLSRRGVLCAGGAGFVSALVATLVGQARTARAQALVGPVPEVDRLAVRIVTDNIVVQFVPGQSLPGLRVERAAGNQSPDRPPRTALAGEWGLAMHAESQRGGEVRHVLVDFGYTPETLLNNLDILKIDPARFDALVLSHGHYDHFGGLTGFLAANKGRLKRRLPFFVGGEDAFCVRTSSTGGQFGALDRQAITDADLALMLADGPAVVAEHAFTTGRIAQRTFEKPLQPTREKVGVANGFGCYPERVSPAKATGDYVPDDFDHEIATNYVVRDKGLVVLTSCSHRGVLNAVRQAQEASGVSRVHAVIGGFHLVPPLTDAYFRDVVTAFKELDPDFLLPGHCSGDAFYDILRRELPNKVIRSAVGTRFVFGA